MRVQKENRVTMVLAGVALFVIFSLCCFNDDLAKVGDSVFLYNRCYQILDCLRNGVYPFLYYEDLGGIGYGSPIFYGHLSLFPFVFFLDDISVFLKVYFLSCLLLNFFGFRFFVKRFTSYATLVSCFYILSLPFLSLYGCNLPANVMAVGFSWFFFGCCVDFFRDGKGFAPLILTYFMIWQSNFNSAVLATIACVGIFVLYFDVSRWLGYANLIYATALTIGYNIYNIVIHLDALRLSDAESMLTVLGEEADCRVTSIHPLGGYWFRLNTGADCCCGFMQFSVFAVLLYFVVSELHHGKHLSRRFVVGSVAVLVVTVAGYIVGSRELWPTVYKATEAFFQFPIRYYIFLFGFVLAVLSRFVRPCKIAYFALAVCIVDVLLVNPLRSAPTENLYYVGLQMGNGEYASNEFLMDYDIYQDWGFSVHSLSGTPYEFTRGYNLIEVDCSGNESDDEVLTLPKLYYRGYQARGADGEVFSVESGYSNYCEVSISDYKGVLRLYYEVPGIVMLFFWIQVACVLSCLWLLVFPKDTRRGRFVRSAGLVCLYSISLACLWVWLQIRVAIMLFWRKRLKRDIDRLSTDF